MSMLERIIAAISPTWAVRRLSSRIGYEMLSTYAAADRSRRNSDWRASNASADLAILDDAKLVNARARQLVRDSWVARSAVNSFVRNVIGRGITPAPAAKSIDGEELPELNTRAERLFWGWASDALACDVEGKVTFWGRQRLAMREIVTVGEHFIAWEYDPTARDRGMPGMKLRAYEPEQLDLTRLMNPENGNEIRGGIEIDRDGKEVAYWFYDRNPNDYMPSASVDSTRVPRFAGGVPLVFHVGDFERVRQTRAISRLHPVAQRIRDVHRRDEAEMWAAIMESCIGMVITQQLGSATSPIIAQAAAMAGGGGTTSAGMTKIDIAPGMIPHLAPGQDMKPFTPTRPGGNYEPHMRAQLRGIAAGIDLSYDQIARDFDQGTWHSKKQGMLEDRRAWRSDQEMLIDTMLVPLYRVWFAIAVLDELLPLSVEKYASDPRRFDDADYVADGHEWTNPDQEVSAIEKAIKLNILTREEVIAQRGGRFRRTMEQVRKERQIAAEHGIDFTEVAEQKAAATVQPGDTEQKREQLNGAQINAAIDVLMRLREQVMDAEAAASLLTGIGFTADEAAKMAAGVPAMDSGAGDVAFKREVLKALLAVPAAREAVYNAMDIEDLVEATGLPPEKGYEAPWIPVVAPTGPLVTGATISDPDGDIVGGDVKLSPAGADTGSAGTGGNRAEAGEPEGDAQDKEDAEQKPAQQPPGE